MVTEHLELDSEGQMQLPDEDEEDLCRVWDMAMDKVHITFFFTCWNYQGMHGTLKRNYNPKCIKTVCVKLSEL